MKPTTRKVIYTLAGIGAIAAGVVKVATGELTAESVTEATSYAIGAFVALLARANVAS